MTNVVVNVLGTGRQPTARRPARSFRWTSAPTRSTPRRTTTSWWPRRRSFGCVSNSRFVLSRDTKRCGCGNVQKLNYGSLGNAPFASPEHFCCVPEDKNAQVRKCSKTPLWIPRQRTLRFTRTCLCCPRRRKRAGAEMFKNLTMDSLARPCFLL